MMVKAPGRNQQIQDSVREEMLMELFGLMDSGEGRIGADAVDKNGRRFELKSGTKKSVTTARDVGLHTLEKWRGKHWLIGFGEQINREFNFTEIHYLAPKDLEGFCKKIEIKIKPDLNILEDAKIILNEQNFDSQKLERLEYLVTRGYTLNNPKIPYRYVLDNGTRLTRWTESELQNAILLRGE
jgi:hypothetical protein